MYTARREEKCLQDMMAEWELLKDTVDYYRVHAVGLEDLGRALLKAQATTNIFMRCASDWAAGLERRK